MISRSTICSPLLWQSLHLTCPVPLQWAHLTVPFEWHTWQSAPDPWQAGQVTLPLPPQISQGTWLVPWQVLHLVLPMALKRLKQTICPDKSYNSLKEELFNLSINSLVLSEFSFSSSLVLAWVYSSKPTVVKTWVSSLTLRKTLSEQRHLKDQFKL